MLSVKFYAKMNQFIFSDFYMDLYSIASKTILFSTGKLFILPFIALSYHLYDRLVISRATYLLLFTFILNKLLKETCADPLQFSFLQGLDLPSGHMQSAAAFWLYLAWETEKKLYKLLSLLYCAAVGFSLIYLKYHNLNDVVAGFGFGVISAWIMSKISYINFFVKREYSLPIFFNIIGLSIMYFLLSNTYPALWISIGGFTGFAIGLYMRELKKLDSVYLGFDIPRPLIFFSVLLGMLSIYGTVSLIGLIPYLNKSFLDFLRYTWLAYWVSCGSEIYLNQLIEKVREQHRLKQEAEGN